MEPIKEDTLQPKAPVETVKPERPTDPFAGVDLDIHRRPGYSSLRGIKPWPNSFQPVERQPRTVTNYMHGRPNKTYPAVYGTDAPPRGVSGWMRKIAYGYPDHMPRHWLLLLAADRVDYLEHRGIPKLLKFGAPALAVGLFARWRLREA